MIEHKKCHIRIKVLPGHLNLARDMPSDEDYKTLLNFDAAKLVIFDRIAKIHEKFLDSSHIEQLNLRFRRRAN